MRRVGKDEAVYKELDDSLVRSANTASSLEAEHDNGKINTTKSKATPNESSSQRTDSGGGPRCQEAMGDTIVILDLHGEEVFVAKQDENVVEKEVDAAQVQVSTAATTATISINEVTLGQALAELKHTKPKAKAKEIVFHELEESTTTTKSTISKLKSQDKEQRIAREKAQKEKEANIALIETWDDVQAKIDDDHQLAEKLQAEEQQELTAEEKATLFMQLLEKRRKFFATKRKKLTDLKNKSFDSIQKMFDKAFVRVNTFVDFRTELVEGSSKRAGEELTQESAKKQKVDDDKEITDLKQLMKIILEEEITIDAIPLADKSLIIDWKIYKEGKKSYLLKT
nr:hypothetical protein [Tanacetum cinerariifolium]